jgi:hypothetical protein
MRARLFFSHFLCILAAWTITIKFIFPISWSFAGGEPLLSHVMWDFWWVAHFYLAWALLHPGRWTKAVTWSVTIAEIVIIVVKFAAFLSKPEWDLWRTNWFINKIFVLGCFVALAVWLLRHPDDLKHQVELGG